MAIGNVQNAVPVGVFPLVLARRRGLAQAMLGRFNDYPSGDHQGVSLVSTPRWAWDIEFACSEAQLAALNAFWDDHDGSMIPFHLYEGAEASPLWSADPTGESVSGRYTARFDGEIVEGNPLGSLFPVSLRMIQIA